MHTLNPTLSQIGKGLHTEGEATVKTPMPWNFLELLCQLDEKEEALASDEAEEQRNSEEALIVESGREKRAAG
jgi:hypothetical protein